MSDAPSRKGYVHRFHHFHDVIIYDLILCPHRRRNHIDPNIEFCSSIISRTRSDSLARIVCRAQPSVEPVSPTDYEALAPDVSCQYDSQGRVRDQKLQYVATRMPCAGPIMILTVFIGIYGQW